jgi:glutamine amidotransferase-like uncharacterized protein
MKMFKKQIIFLTLLLGLTLILSLNFASAVSENTTSQVNYSTLQTSKATTNTSISSRAAGNSVTYVSISQVTASASLTKKYIETNKKIPYRVKVGNNYVTPSQFLHLMTTATVLIQHGRNYAIPIRSDASPASSVESLNKGTLFKADYVDFAKRIKTYMDTNHKAPSYGVVGLGKTGYESQIYLYSRVLYQYQLKKSLPSFINLSSWKSSNIPILDNPNPIYTPIYIANIAVKIKNYYETNNKLPSNVKMGLVYVNMAQFLHLETTAILQINSLSNRSIPLKTDYLPSNSVEELNSGSLSKTAYLDFASRIKKYIDDKKVAPTYGVVSLGKMSYKTMVYTYSKVLSSYFSYKVLPSTVSVNGTKLIKVLLYSGAYAGSDCVTGTKQTLDYANSSNMVPGFRFSYATTSIISSQNLSSYDLLIMPGGDGGRYYLDSGNISGSAIRSFVANGGGFIGVCAGAYAACSHVDGWYDGWGIAPHIRCKEVNYVGKLLVTITSNGQKLFNYSGNKSLLHWNGPAMYSYGGWVPFATYTDNTTGYSGYAAIAGDYYGKGRVVLIGPHPELTSTQLNMIPLLIKWATNN